MPNQNKMKKSIGCLTLAFFFCPSAFAQQQSDRPRRTSEQGRNEYGVAQAPDLTQENLGRVAASAIQIRGVLVKDEGLMVELKRWVAKEATDNGQIVEDSTLSDQAIFDRLERDITFRSVATRLVQRYGYLLPSVNPDSEIGKEQELVLKERARRLVQIEAQEDAQSLTPRQGAEEGEENEVHKAQSRECDPQRERSCGEPSSGRTGFEIPPTVETPAIEPNLLPAVPSQTPPSSTGRTLRASAGRGDSYLQGGSEIELSQAAAMEGS